MYSEKGVNWAAIYMKTNSVTPFRIDFFAVGITTVLEQIGTLRSAMMKEKNGGVTAVRYLSKPDCNATMAARAPPSFLARSESLMALTHGDRF